MSRGASFEAVRAKIAAMDGGTPSAGIVLPFGDTRLDGVFPAGGLPLGVWHEVGGEGLEVETAAAAGAFVATLAGRLARGDGGDVGRPAGRGALVWVMRRDDLHPPGLAAFGLPTDRLIQVKARGEAQVLAALEDALGAAGVAVAIGEAEAVDLTAGRRLQLACERRGTTGFVIRRRPFGGAARKAAGGGSAAATRWSVACAPSGRGPSEFPSGGLGDGEGSGGETWGLGPPRWRVELKRCRGGRTGRWILETSDGAYPLRVVAELGDGQLEAAPPDALAGRRRAV
jgi:protein ImuA